MILSLWFYKHGTRCAESAMKGFAHGLAQWVAATTFLESTSLVLHMLADIAWSVAYRAHEDPIFGPWIEHHTGALAWQKNNIYTLASTFAPLLIKGDEEWYDNVAHEIYSRDSKAYYATLAVKRKQEKERKEVIVIE